MVFLSLCLVSQLVYHIFFCLDNHFPHFRIILVLRRSLTGVHPDFLWNLFLTKQLPSKLRHVTELLIGLSTPTAHRFPRGSHAHSWSNYGSIMLTHLNMQKTNIFGALLVASGLLNSYIKFHPDLTTNGWVMSQKLPYKLDPYLRHKHQIW